MDEFCLCIIDNSTSAEAEDQQVSLIWAGCLIAERSAAASLLATTMYIPVRFEHFSEQQKVEMYINFLISRQKQHNEPHGETIRGLKTAFEFIQANKKRKGKNQEQIVILKKMEKVIEQGFTAYMDYYRKYLDAKKLTALLPLITTNKEGEKEKPLDVWHVPDNNNLENGQRIVTMFSDIITAHDRLLLFRAETIKRHTNMLQLSDRPVSVEQGNNPVLCDPLFDLPELISLTTQQLQIVRNDLSSTAWKLMEVLCDLNRALENISFTENNFSAIAGLYKEKTHTLKTEVQKAVEENIYLNRMKTETGTEVTYRLRAGMSTFHTVLYIYREQNIIDLSAEAYLKEAVSAKVDLNGTRLFLFLETETINF